MSEIPARETFADSYETARAAFRDTCDRLRLDVDEIVFTGADGEEAIDVAHAGDPAARNKLVVTSGLHGIEGYCGGAAQIEFLQAQAARLDRVHVLVVHGINPSGMRAFRRVNAANVDLNRNMVGEAARRQAPDEIERIIDDWVNGPDKFRRLGALWTPAFLARLAPIGGPRALKTSLAGGQFFNADGLFYGGAALQPELAALTGWLRRALGGGADRALLVDLHSGVGGYGEYQIIAVSPDKERIARIFETRPKLDHTGGGGLHAARGDFVSGAAAVVDAGKVDAAVFECGTGPALATFLALRADNMAHRHFPENRRLRANARRRMRRAFCPPDPRWRAIYVTQAGRILERAVRHLRGEGA